MKRFILAIVFVFCCSLGMTPPAEAGLISKEQEIEMGRQTAMQLEAKYGVVQDYALQERVNRIGQSLVKVSERQDLEYSFKVLNSDEVNALACPGGFIYVFKGLIDYMPSDAELAGVLGHEITHVVKKHTVHQIEKQLLTTLAFAIVTKGDLGIAGLATQALAAGYSRTDERGADKGGFNLCVAAGYNPYSVVLTINKLEDLAKEQGNPGYGIFSSHPEPEERLKRVMKQIKALKVHPEITLNEDNTARVHEGDWGFNITQTVGNDRPEYRAYMLAGGLYCVRERDKGGCTQDVGSRNLQGQGADEEICLLQHRFCQAVLAICMELDIAGQFVLKTGHHQAGQAETAGADDADDDFAGKDFLAFEALQGCAEMDSQIAYFFFGNRCIQGLCQDGGSAEGFLENRGIFLSDIVQQGIDDIQMVFQAHDSRL